MLMLAKDHLEKAKRLKKTCAKLDPESDWETIVEDAYGIALHLIACIMEKRIEEHMDTHRGLISYLTEHKLPEVSALFRELDELRTGRWYGGRENGKSARRAFEIVGELERMVDEAGAR